MLQKQHLKIKYLPIDQLSPNPSNPRTHTKKQIKQLARSIQQFGFVNPLIVDSSGRILAGHGRLEAANAQHVERRLS
jgi:ParB-like chromosome segregation protein Spo0J